jgi:hypothetical protein
MSSRHQRAEGFTIVEVLVVIGVLGLLIGLLLPALSGVQKKGQKLKELNALRQVGNAWLLYANSSSDRILPGFLDTTVQRDWRVSFEYRNGDLIPPAPGYGGAVGSNVAGPWTWRLLPFMDYGYEMVCGHVDDLETEGIDLGESPVDSSDTAAQIAFQPGFGYNAFYVGGWWETTGDIPRYRFHDGTVGGRAKSLVETSVAQIKRSSELITFCSAGSLPEGTYRRIRRDQPGAHYVTPPMLGPDPMWSPASQGDPLVLQVIEQPDYQGYVGGSPIGRYNSMVAALRADNHTALETPWSLLDMRFWVDVADDDRFEHD